LQTAQLLAVSLRGKKETSVKFPGKEGQMTSLRSTIEQKDGGTSKADIVHNHSSPSGTLSPCFRRIKGGVLSVGGQKKSQVVDCGQKNQGEENITQNPHQA